MSELTIQTELLPNGASIQMVHVEGGRFMMGSNYRGREQPIHEVEVPDFYIGKYPITISQYMEFVAATHSHYPEWLEEGSKYHIETGAERDYKQIETAIKAPNAPMVGISWNDATAYCDWLSEVSGKAYRFRLPSESEWEYAARGGKYSQGYRYAGSNKVKKVGWFRGNSHRELKAVGQKYPNEIDLYDMSGNVWEWCADVWHANYEGAPQDGSTWLEGGKQYSRVVRGGSWYDYDDYCRVSYRDRYYVLNRFILMGFRLARY